MTEIVGFLATSPASGISQCECAPASSPRALLRRLSWSASKTAFPIVTATYGEAFLEADETTSAQGSLDHREAFTKRKRFADGDSFDTREARYKGS